MLFNQTISTQPFIQWLVQDKENKRLLWFSIAIMIISYGWLKVVYPYPNFMPPDSYSYLNTAYKNEFVAQLPIGYSKFLRLVSVFSRSHLLLVILQYLLLMTSVLYFLFTIRYLFNPGKWLFRVLLAVSMVNPLLPHISNFVSGDCLFAALSLVWFTQLLWIIARPGLHLLLFHALILLLAFMVRLSAIWYPFISIAIIVLSGLISKRIKWLGLGSIVTLFLIFIGCTQHEYQKKTGYIQYAAYSGWQIAANSLYAYAHARPVDPNTVPDRIHNLHALVNLHMDSLRKSGNWPYTDIGTYYLTNLNSPLMMYVKNKWKDSPKLPNFSKWASVGSLYDEYGRWLITEHPWLYLKHFAWPNLVRYYKPPTQAMGVYNFHNRTVDSTAMTWFNWKNNQLPCRLADTNIYIMDHIQTLLAIINPLFITSMLMFLFFWGLKQCSKNSKHLLICMMLVWVVNCVVSILSVPTELRHQIFSVVITLPFCILFMSWMVRSFQSTPTPSMA